MPTYDYVCDQCGHEFEKFQSITARPLRKCPDCRRRALQRLIGSGAGIIFKGSGFYETDYRSDSYKKAAEADKKAADGSKDDKGGKDSKSGDAQPTKSAEKTVAGTTTKAKASPAGNSGSRRGRKAV